jgi:hypothetical protein
MSNVNWKFSFPTSSFLEKENFRKSEVSGVYIKDVSNTRRILVDFQKKECLLIVRINVLTGEESPKYTKTRFNIKPATTFVLSHFLTENDWFEISKDD